MSVQMKITAVDSNTSFQFDVLTCIVSSQHANLPELKSAFQVAILLIKNLKMKSTPEILTEKKKEKQKTCRNPDHTGKIKFLIFF